MHLLKQSTAASVLVGPVLDSAGAAYTGMLIGDFTLTKNGTSAALAAAATATHDGNGCYIIALTTGNTGTLGRAAIYANKDTYTMTIARFSVLTAATFDALITNAAGTAGGLLTSDASNGAKLSVGTGAGQLNVASGNAPSNVTQWAGNAVVATNVNGVPIVDVQYVLGDLASVSNGTAQAGASTSITLSSSEPATSNFYVGRQVTIVSGTANGQARFITAYNGSTKVATVHRAWDVAPDATSQYAIDSLIETDAYQFVGQTIPANVAALQISSDGIVSANVVQFAGAVTYAYDGILAGATATTVTFPATDVAGNAIPDDGRFRFMQFDVVGATGAGQTVALGERTLTPRQYNVVAGTMPVPCDATSQYVLRGSIIAEIDMFQPVPMTNTAGTTGDSFNAARAQGFGKWTWPVGSQTLTLFGPDNITPVHTFTEDSATTPRSRS